MKTRRLLLTLSFIAAVIVTGYGQDLKTKDVPAGIRTTFKKSYPQARDIDWEKAGANYEVSFEIGHIDHKAIYNPADKLLSHQKEILSTALPSAIATNIKSKYPQARIDDVEWISTAGKVSYKIDLDGTPDATLYYTSDGKFIREVPD